MIKSAVVTVSGVVENVSCVLHAVHVTTPGSGSSTFTVYDNATSAAGKVAIQGDGVTEMSYGMGDYAGGGTGMTQGIYVALAGTTKPTVVVTYE